MSVGEDKDDLSSSIAELKASFDQVDLTAINDTEEIYSHLDRIGKVDIQVQQFKCRWTSADWTSWGPKRWADIEQIRRALGNALSRNERDARNPVVTGFFQRKWTDAEKWLMGIASALVLMVVGAVVTWFLQ